MNFLTIDSTNYEDYIFELKELCLSSLKDSSLSSQNMAWENWKNNSKSLMHTIAIQKRYDSPNGLFNLVIKNKIPMYCSGCYVSDWSRDVLVMGVRTWTHPDYRKEWWKGNPIIPKQLDFAKKNKFKAAVFTFNEYNLWLAEIMKRTTNGKAIVFGRKNSNVYKDFKLLDNYFLIKNTKQKISVNLLNCSMNEFQQYYLPKEYNDTCMG